MHLCALVALGAIGAALFPVARGVSAAMDQRRSRRQGTP